MLAAVRGGELGMKKERTKYQPVGSPFSSLLQLLRTKRICGLVDEVDIGMFVCANRFVLILLIVCLAVVG